MKIHYDRKGNTLHVWFDGPKHEPICEETGDEAILVKNRRGKVIGFEKLNFLSSTHHAIKRFPVEVSVS